MKLASSGLRRQTAKPESHLVPLRCRGLQSRARDSADKTTSTKDGKIRNPTARTKPSPAALAPPRQAEGILEHDHVGCLRSFVPLDHVEGHGLSLTQVLEAGADDGRKMDEDVRAPGLFQEAEPLLLVE